MIATTGVEADSQAQQGRPWVLYLAPITWNGPRQRQHELALQLAREFRVLFVEPPTRQGSLSINPVPIQERVSVLRPWGPFPLARVVAPLNLVTRLVLSGALARWLDRQDAPAVLWVDENLASACAGRCGETAVVYDAVDADWTFTRPWNRRHLKRGMRIARRRASVTFASSETFLAHLPPSMTKSLVLANACDPSHFCPEGRTAPELRETRRPILGFIGTASSRALDVALLEGLARRRPEWSLLFVGPYEESVKNQLTTYDNVAFLGERSYGQLPSFVRGFDVCTIPYRVGGNVDYVFPKKLLEYFATGRPVVATPLPELRAFQPHVRLAATIDEFVHGVESSLSERVDDAGRLAARERRALALENTWEHRGAVVRRVVAELLEAA